MAITATWTPSIPTGSSDRRTIPTNMRDLKSAIAERNLAGGHIQETTATLDPYAGRHSCGVEYAAGGTSALANEFYIYDTDKTTKIMTVRGASHATPGVVVASGTLTVPHLSIASNVSIVGTATIGTITATTITAATLTVTSACTLTASLSLSEVTVTNCLVATGFSLLQNPYAIATFPGVVEFARGTVAATQWVRFDAPMRMTYWVCSTGGTTTWEIYSGANHYKPVCIADFYNYTPTADMRIVLPAHTDLVGRVLTIIKVGNNGTFSLLVVDPSAIGFNRSTYTSFTMQNSSHGCLQFYAGPDCWCYLQNDVIGW